MNQKEVAAVNDVLGKLRKMFDAETEQIQNARKSAIPGLLDRLDNTQSMIRALNALVSDNG